MAKIPVFGGEKRISMDAPRASSRFETAGLMGQSLQRLGEGVQRAGIGVGGVIKDMERARKLAEISEYSETSSREYKRELQGYSTVQSQQRAGTDFKGYTEEMENFSSQVLERLEKNAPSEEAKLSLRNRIAGVTDNFLLSSDTLENKKRAEFYEDNLFKEIDKFALHYGDNPDPFEADTDLLKFKNDLKNGELNRKYSPELVIAASKDVTKKVRLSVFDGLIRDDLPGVVDPTLDRKLQIAQLEEFLGGRTPGSMGNILEGMTVEEKSKWMTKFINKIDTMDKANKRETKNLVDGAEAVLIEGGVNNINRPQIEEATIRASQIGDPLTRKQYLQRLSNAKKVGDFAKSIVTTNFEDLTKLDMDEQMKLNDISVAEENIKARNMMALALRKNLAERNKDGQAYLEKYEPRSAFDPERSYQRQRELGIKDPRVISKKTSESLSLALLEEVTPDRRAVILDQIVNGDPKSLNPEKERNFGLKKVAQLVEDNKNLSAAYMVAAIHPSTLVKSQIIANDSNKKGIENRFKTEMSGETNIFKSEILEKTADFRAVTLSSDLFMQRISDEMIGAVGLEAKRIMVDKGKNRSTAIEEAYNTILGNTYTIVNDSKAKVLIPKKFGIGADTFGSFIEASLTDNSLKNFGVNKARHTFAGTDEEFYREVRDTGIWRSNKSGDGVELWFVDRQTQHYGKVRDSNGSSIEVRYRDLETTPEVETSIMGILKQQKDETAKAIEKITTERKFEVGI